jgi:hypothetical protein
MYKRRWYDRDEGLARPITQLHMMPEAIGIVIANGLLMLAEGHYGVIQTSQKILGQEKVLALHKAQRKQRAMDQQPVIHGALLRFYMLDAQQRRKFSYDLSAMITNTLEYLQLCRKFNQVPQIETIGHLTNIYVSRDQVQTQIYLLSLHKEMGDLIVLEEEAAERKNTVHHPPRLIMDN